MKKFIKSSVLLACLVTPAFAVSAENAGISYHRLNDLLKEVHRAYLVKDFHKIDKVRPAFLKEYNSFNERLNNGSIRLVTQVQKDDLKLARNYYSSLTKYYEALQRKYGHTQGSISEVTPVTKPEIISTLSESTKTSDSLMSILNGASTSNPDLCISEGLTPQIQLLDVADDMQDPSDEEYLEHEIPAMINEKRVGVALNKFFADKYGKELIVDAEPPALPDEASIPEIPEEALKAAREASEGNYLLSGEFNKKIEEIRKARVLKTYKEESKIVQEGLKKIKLLKENQARFEIKTMDESKAPERRSEVKAKAKPPVFTHDRLAEDDEDVIIIKFQREEE